MLDKIREFIKNFKNNQSVFVNGVEYLSNEILPILPIGLTTNKDVNFRKQPGMAAWFITDVIPENTLVFRVGSSVIINAREWYQIFYKGQFGWCASSFFNSLDTKIIDVPYYSQLVSGALKFRQDCGVACIKMLCEFHKIETPTIDRMSELTSLMVKDNGLTLQQLDSLAKYYGLSTFVIDATIQRIKILIDSQTPLVVLIDYEYIPNRWDKKYTGQHFVVVTGYDDNYIYYNDPDYPNETGKNVKTPITNFDNALRKANPNYRGIF